MACEIGETASIHIIWVLPPQPASNEQKWLMTYGVQHLERPFWDRDSVAEWLAGSQFVLT